MSQYAQLSELTLGEQARLVAFKGLSKAERQKFMSMGLVPGTAIRLIRYAPLGCPVQLEVRGSALCLRKAQGQSLLLEKLA